MSDNFDTTTGTAIEPPIGDNGSPVPPPVNERDDDRDDTLPDECTTAEVLYSDDEDDGNAVPDEMGDGAGLDGVDADVDAEVDAGRDAPPVDTSNWTAEDAATYTTLQYEAQNFQRDLQDFATAKAKLAEMEQTDPERARAFAPQIQAAEKELKERYGALEQAGQQFAQGTSQRRLETEKSRMVEAVPELATDEGKAALKKYLTEDLGFSPQEITAPDHRLAKMAWQAMKYQEMTSGKPQKKVIPKITKKSAKAKGGKKAAPAKQKTPLDKTLESLYGPTPARPTTPSRDDGPSREDILYGSSS